MINCCTLPSPGSMWNIENNLRSPGSIVQLYTNLVPFTGTSPSANPYLLLTKDQKIFYNIKIHSEQRK